MTLASPYATGRPIENFFLVRERDRRRRRELVLVVFGLLPLAAALLAFTWIHLEVRQTGYGIERLERRLVELRDLERRLDLETSYLSSPARIESEASALLGMVLPTLEDMIFVEEP